MSIREATVSDLRAIGEACAAAFMDEELFGELMHPRRHEYPEDFIHYWERKIGNHMISPSRQILVGIDDRSGTVTGVADWQRQGKGAKKRAERLFTFIPYYNVLRAEFTDQESTDDEAFVTLVASYLDTLPSDNRACDPTKLSILKDSAPLVQHFWSGKREENWTLDLLAVHPAIEGRGHGKRLVQWGIEEAKKEGVFTSVVSADGKDGFYERFGFVKVGMANVGPLAENGMKGGIVMFIDA